MKVINWGEEYEVAIIKEQYVFGERLCLSLICTDEECYGEPYGNLTVNLEGGDCAPDEAYVDTNNMSYAIDFIERYKLGKPTGKTMRSGYCEYPQYKFDMNEVKKYLLE